MYPVKQGKYLQRSQRINGKVHTIHMGKTTDEKKQTAYEIATGEKIQAIDEKITELYIGGMGAQKISDTIGFEDEVVIGKNPITARLKELGVYEGDRRKRSPAKVDHEAIEEENNRRIRELERQLDRAEFRAKTAEDQLRKCRVELDKVRDDRNESDRRLRLIDEGIKVV